MLRSFIGRSLEQILTGVGTALSRRGLTPTTLSLMGLGINGMAAFCYYQEWLVTGGIVVLCAGVFDMLDGAVARASHLTSRIGAFTDSVVDRYSDLLIFGGVVALFAKKADLSGVFLGLAGLSGAFLVSYVRARAELVIPRCDVGLMERPERILALAAGSLFGLFEVALWFLALSTHLTALHRIYYTFKVSKRPS